VAENRLIYESIDFATTESCDKSVNNTIKLILINT